LRLLPLLTLRLITFLLLLLKLPLFLLLPLMLLPFRLPFSYLISKRQPYLISL